jgi:hypothetical protein
VCLEERVQTAEINGSYATDHPSATSTDPDLPDIIDISQAEWDEIKWVLVLVLAACESSVFGRASSDCRGSVPLGPSWSKVSTDRMS